MAAANIVAEAGSAVAAAAAAVTGGVTACFAAASPRFFRGRLFRQLREASGGEGMARRLGNKA